MLNINIVNCKFFAILDRTLSNSQLISVPRAFLILGPRPQINAESPIKKNFIF